MKDARTDARKQLTDPDPEAELINERPIRDLVEVYPELMATLAQHGIDLCCGGGLTIAEAVRVYDIELGPIVERVSAIARPRD